MEAPYLYGIPSSDFLHIDDLLDFSNDDIFAPLESDSPPTSMTLPEPDREQQSPEADTHRNFPGCHDVTEELCVPVDFPLMARTFLSGLFFDRVRHVRAIAFLSSVSCLFSSCFGIGRATTWRNWNGYRTSWKTLSPPPATRALRREAPAAEGRASGPTLPSPVARGASALVRRSAIGPLG